MLLAQPLVDLSVTRTGVGLNHKTQLDGVSVCGSEHEE
jgi:hypothetical protein